MFVLVLVHIILCIALVPLYNFSPNAETNFCSFSLKASCVQRYFSILAGENSNHCQVSMFKLLLFLQNLSVISIVTLYPICGWLLLIAIIKRFLVNLYRFMGSLIILQGPLHVLWSEISQEKIRSKYILYLFLFFSWSQFYDSSFQYLQILISQFLSMFLNLFIRKISFLMVMMMIITVYYSCKYSFCKMKMWKYICSGLDKNPRS